MAEEGGVTGIRGMVFARRRRLALVERVRGWLWPYIGWRRAGRYVLMRVQRLPGSPHSIAAGLAAGIAVSFTPLLGFHFLLSFLLAWAVRGNLIAAAVGTLAGNPWTFPFMFAASYHVGAWLLDHSGAVASGIGWEGLVEDLWSYFVPMLVGSIPVGAAAWVACYLLLLRPIAAFQERRRLRRLAKAARRLAAGAAAE
jgi:uncharacterized protein (DUF2062 family)